MADDLWPAVVVLAKMRQDDIHRPPEGGEAGAVGRHGYGCKAVDFIEVESSHAAPAAGEPQQLATLSLIVQGAGCGNHQMDAGILCNAPLEAVERQLLEGSTSRLSGGGGGRGGGGDGGRLEG